MKRGADIGHLDILSTVDEATTTAIDALELKDSQSSGH